MNIDQQIAWLDSVVDVFVLDCEPKQNLAEVRNTLERLRAVLEAADGWQKQIQQQLEQHDCWQQFDFLPEPMDLYWFYQTQRAIKGVSDELCLC